MAYIARLLLLICTLLLPLRTELPQPNQLEQIITRGELRVVTRNAATTYFLGANGASGMEYELAKGFADQLGLTLRLITVNTINEVLQQLDEGAADIAAAGLTMTAERQQHYRFTPPYQQVSQHLIYRSDRRRPASINDIPGDVEVIASSSHSERLRQIQQQHQHLRWFENSELGSEQLLALLWEGLIDYTIADTNTLQLNQPLYPELRSAFTIGEPESLAWALQMRSDTSFYDVACDYFNILQRDGRLATLLERYYSHVDDFDYIEVRTFRRHIATRLPNYRTLFEQQAAANDLDWRLLAAVAYQESHWDPKAVSPTGVRGIMMLTRATAKQLGISRREDPAQSIEGGARYLRQLINTIPKRISEPDRSWLALASYNIGFGHLEDARILTQRQGATPDRWLEVKQRLPLLQQPKWYQQTKHGYARGNEAKRYVENIRSYYHILKWVMEQRPAPDEEPPASLQIVTPVL